MPVNPLSMCADKSLPNRDNRGMPPYIPVLPPKLDNSHQTQECRQKVLKFFPPSAISLVNCKTSACFGSMPFNNSREGLPPHA